MAWIWSTGRLDHLSYRAQSGADASVAGLGLTLEKVQLNRDPKYTLKRDIRAAIGASEGGAILSATPEEIRENLLSLPWVKDATVERRLPNIIAIGLTEREPLAIWQNNGAFHLLDSAGKTIVSDASVLNFTELPRLVGKDADVHALDLLAQMHDHPRLDSKLAAAVLINERRWDLLFENGVRVLLPEFDNHQAISRLANLDKVDSLLDRDVIEVDLRLRDRMVVRRGTPQAISGGALGDGNGGYFNTPSPKPNSEDALGQPT